MARAPDAGVAASLSAFAQSVGYLVASVGPLMVGLLHTATGSWNIPVVLLLVLAAIELAVGVLAGRPLTLPPGPGDSVRVESPQDRGGRPPGSKPSPTRVSGTGRARRAI
jgi:hypothetical protein